MGVLRVGAAALLTAVVAVQSQAGTQVAATALEANRIVCADEGARLISDLRKEIKAAQQTTWTDAQERERQEADLKAALNDAALRAQFKAAFPEIWQQATDFIQKPELVLAACAVTLADAWDAGVREIPTLERRWAEAKHTKYKLPGAPAPPTSGRTADEDSSDDPVECVDVDELEVGSSGTFRNRCDFDVYFTYCGINPEDSRTADCNKQSFGLLDVAARGVQAGFLRGAGKIYLFECRSPRTPKEVEFVGNGLRGFCK